MGNTAFFAVLIVLIFGILYVMKSSDNPPETSINQTPKEYIEMVEQKKAARLSVEQSLQQGEEKTRQSVQDGEAQR
ncbi:MAG: aldehyde dehydrogenase [Candidatus Thiodiazotropha sp. (ex Lucinoma kastoroae)]|nr:aldehyde dehydrogenase [Candidatus Thiodiazotropha sp.]MCU7805160.1 aldehyde dehydrogenase [Candidatus Thiodiazotropha sp. (ex Lucinoma borealis)]MCU7816565.1 aldehyde dehydrogenase [Candidatus Thiodiazotropha sp. (ex Rostrolucina anterorostrata)]MCU7838158.1 aldehyde dehydrogenase [Candidatus Thiodiazotropha sp. (ex Troendleina suluensis)]MCU7847360.1 aldehyde dehydrogenase [Candidatus Thiodiazotropha sp. (ex Lucinoma kastoroae)]MCU7885198.1 aldehyde dehydrogenase [Candidatus Thiodiazotrop